MTTETTPSKKNSGKANDTGDGSSGHEPIIVGLRKQKRKRIRQLLKGRGRLMDDVHDTIDQLVEEGVVEENAKTIVIVVPQKKGRCDWTL